MDWWTFNPSCCVGFSRPAAFNTAWSLGSGRRTSQLHMQRVDTVGVLKTEDGNQRREKKRWMEADVSKGNSHAGKPSQLQNKLHVKVNELLRQLQQGDQQLKDLWKVNDSLTEEIALKKKPLKKKPKTCKAVSWVSPERQGLAGGAAEPSKRKIWREIGWQKKRTRENALKRNKWRKRKAA